MAGPRLGYNLPITTKQGSIIKPNLGVVGGEETIKILHDIPNKMRDKIAKKALRAGGKILQRSMATHAPLPHGRKTKNIERSYGKGKRKKKIMQLEGGILRKAILATGGVILRKNPFNKWPVVWVGPTWKKYGKPYNAWYAHFAEFGTVKYKKRPKGYQYANKAFKFSYDRVVNEIKKYITNWLNNNT